MYSMIRPEIVCVKKQVWHTAIFCVCVGGGGDNAYRAWRGNKKIVQAAADFLFLHE